MASIADTLRAFEARAERALVQDLRQMAKDILTVRPLLLRHERDYADALMLKLLRQARDQLVAPASTSGAPTFLMPGLRIDDVQAPQPAVYKVYFYDREYGGLLDVITLDAFDAGVQLVRDRLDLSTECVVEAGWTNGTGTVKVLSPRGTVLATVEPSSHTSVAVHPVVSRACQALQSGDASRIDRLFSVMLKAA